jgi:ABC-2 type transport system permease protein
VCPAATPAALRPVSLALPTTYWLEGMRRALLGPTELSPALAGWGHAHLLPAPLAGTVVLTTAAHWWFRRSERRAWQLGRYDHVIGY